MRRAVSEFPNDNPELHDGLVWSVPSPCARALPTLRLRAPEGPPPKVIGPAWVRGPSEPARAEAPAERAEETRSVVVAAASEAPEEPIAALPEPIEAPAPPVDDLPCAADPEPVEVAPETPFEQFVSALSRVLLERGATRAALGVRALLGLEPLRPESFEPQVLEALRVRGILERDALRPTAGFTELAAAWRGVLDGTALDLSGCGNTTLDVWASQLLGALVNAPRDRTDDLRRELRKRGVAAFGLLAAA